MFELLRDATFGGCSSGFDRIEVVAAFRTDDRRCEPLRVVAAEEAVAVVVHCAGHRFEHRIPDDIDRGSCNKLVAVGEDDREEVMALWRRFDDLGTDASEIESVDDLGSTR